MIINYWIQISAESKTFFETFEQWLDAIDKEKFNQENLHLVSFLTGSEKDSYYDTFFYKEIKYDKEDGFYIPGHFPEVYRTKEELIEANKPSPFIVEALEETERRKDKRFVEPKKLIDRILKREKGV